MTEDLGLSWPVMLGLGSHSSLPSLEFSLDPFGSNYIV